MHGVFYSILKFRNRILFLCKLWFEYLLKVFGILIEISQNIRSAVAATLYYKLTFGIWALMVVVRTNAYKGTLVSDLTAPLPIVGME